MYAQQGENPENSQGDLALLLTHEQVKNKAACGTKCRAGESSDPGRNTLVGHGYGSSSSSVPPLTFSQR